MSRLVCCLTLTILLLSPLGSIRANEELLQEFQARVEAAYGATNKVEALTGLVHLEAVDDETVKMSVRFVGRLAEMDSPTVSFDPLPDGFEASYILNGFEYRANLVPLGYLVLDGSARVPYGEVDGRYMIPATERRLVNAEAPPDKMLQMILIGNHAPALRFKGYCIVRLSDGSDKRIEFDDNGNGNNSRMVHGQHFRNCKAENLTGEGNLSLRLLEGTETIFEQRVTAPNLKISFERK